MGALTSLATVLIYGSALFSTSPSRAQTADSVAIAAPPSGTQHYVLCVALEEAAVGMELSRDATVAGVQDDVRLAGVASGMGLAKGLSPDAKTILVGLAESRDEAAKVGRSIAVSQSNFIARMRATLARECS